jgi:hypothetical protein
VKAVYELNVADKDIIIKCEENQNITSVNDLTQTVAPLATDGLCVVSVWIRQGGFPTGFVMRMMFDDFHARPLHSSQFSNNW